MKYIKGLDTLRAFAVLTVLIGHYTEDGFFGPVNSSLLSGLIPPPRFGVDLFFVLSGFLITSILLNANESGESQPHIIKNFIVRRTLRIFPIYYLTLSVLLLIGYPFVGQYKGWFLTYTSNILCFIQQSWNPFGHTWSLAVEEQFYLIWPWLIVFVRPRYQKYIFYLAIGMGIATTVAFRIQSNPSENFAMVLMPACLHAFGIGGLYAWVARDIGKKRVFVKVINILFPLALLLHFYWGFSPDGGHLNYYYRIVDCIISIWLIHHVIAIRSGWFKEHIIENGLLMSIGRISYGLYLYHFMIPTIYRMVITRWCHENSPARLFLMTTPVALAICLVFLFLLARASYKYIEKPFLELKKYFAYEKPQGLRSKMGSSVIHRP